MVYPLGIILFGWFGFFLPAGRPPGWLAPARAPANQPGRHHARTGPPRIVTYAAMPSLSRRSAPSRLVSLFTESRR